MNTGDPMRLAHVAVKARYTEDYLYNQESGLETIVTKFSGQPSSPIRQHVTRAAISQT